MDRNGDRDAHLDVICVGVRGGGRGTHGLRQKGWGGRLRTAGEGKGYGKQSPSIAEHVPNSPPGDSAIRKDTFPPGRCSAGPGYKAWQAQYGRVAGPIISLPAPSARAQKVKWLKKWRKLGRSPAR